MRLHNVIIMGVCVISIGVCGGYVVRERQTSDTVAPQISFDSDVITKSVSDGDSALLEGVAAQDDRDGDVSDSVIVEKVEKIDGTTNEFNVTYVAFDQSGNYVTANRTLIYEDYYAPHFVIKQPLRFPTTSGANISKYIEVYDCYGMSLTPYILIEGVNQLTNTNVSAGTYECTFKIKNDFGDMAELPVSVELYDSDSDQESLRPEVLLSEYVVYIQQGDAFNYVDYIKSIDDNRTIYVDTEPMVEVQDPKTGEVSLVTPAVLEEREGNWVNISEIGFETNLDVNVLGNYTATYTYESTRTGLKGTTTMYLVVE